MNVRFNYLYRDAGNYKSFGTTVFTNPHGLTLVEIESRLRKSFFENDLFIAGQIGIQEVFLYGPNEGTEDDISFHEFESVELTDDAASDVGSDSISEFLDIVEKAARAGWRTFEPHPGY
ncbi:MAG TPA: hypothetical protein PL001_07405 [Candidatus Kryptobacter bacterium]|nr:hypothetical protein [Candidatus Kryptobacter bacterium]